MQTSRRPADEPMPPLASFLSAFISPRPCDDASDFLLRLFSRLHSFPVIKDLHLFRYETLRGSVIRRRCSFLAPDCKEGDVYAFRELR